MFDKTKWSVMTQPQTDVDGLCHSLSIGPICAKLLINRGYFAPADAEAFIKKADSFLYNPFLMADMQSAVDRITRAIKADEKITVYGDYDVDGVTAVTILYSYLKERGADVDYYIPTREGEGYGVSNAAFQTIREGGTKLVVTVDTGITAIDEIAYARSIGLDVVVTDHHVCHSELPMCDAVVNPQREDCEYPFSELSGVGVAFKVMCALELTLINFGEYNLFTIKDMCRRYIDLVAFGTVADVMPLRDENRILVYMGLRMLENSRNIGIRALLKAVGIQTKNTITAFTIGYTLAPKINAAGRIGNASRAVKLFLSTSSQAADVIAEELCATNLERQATENEILSEALSIIESEHEPEKESILVVAGEHWHQGVIGIVASRIAEQFGKPAILISFDGADSGEHGIGKGSCRSIKGLNLVEALSDSGDLLVKFGGHELAAGLAIERGNLSAFRTKINAHVTDMLQNSSAIQPLFTVETEISDNEITEKTISEMEQLEPYGAANPEPLFLLRNATIAEIASLSAGKHTRLIVKKGTHEFSAICFRNNLIAEGFSAKDAVDLVVSIGINEFRGDRKIQLMIRDIDYADSVYGAMEKDEKALDAWSLADASPIMADEIPKRSEFTELYNAMRGGGFSSGKHTRLMKLIAGMKTVSYMKAQIMLEVLRESGLCEAERVTRGTYYIKLIPSSEKKDLTATPLMKKLLNAYDGE